MASSYSKHAIRLISNTQTTSLSTFQLIGQLDEAITKLAGVIDKKLALIKASSSVSSITSLTQTSANMIALEDVRKLARLIEDLTEKKAQLAIKNYDLIDHNMKLIERDLDIVRKVKRLHPEFVPSETEEVIAGVISTHDQDEVTAGTQNKKRKIGGKIEEYTVDPNEPVYCFCRQIAYGDMVQCDDEACEIEWFHYPCVNLSKTPKSKWLCPTCSTKRKR